MLHLTQSRTSVVSMCCFWLICSLLAVALAFPTLFVALDHHGVERLPTHLHVTSTAGVADAHAHTYDVAHSHAGTAADVESSAALIVRAAAQTPLFVLLTLVGLALPALAVTLFKSPTRWRVSAPRAARHQSLSRPPTPPPTILPVSL